MSTDLGALFGYPAAFLTTVAFVPQAWQSWRARDLSGISLPIVSMEHQYLVTDEIDEVKQWGKKFPLLRDTPLLVLGG